MSLKIDRVQLEIVVQQDSARKRMLELEKEMRTAYKTLNELGDRIGKNSNIYKEQEKVIKDLKKEYDELFSQMGIGNLSLRELTNRQRDLNVTLRNLNPNTPEWKQYNQQLKEINARIRELRNESKETQFSVAKLADGFNRYAAIGASVIASMTGVALTARKCVDEYAEMEEAQSQVIKYTGLTKKETEELNEEFKKMDTRTPREELNRLAGEAGKLGISSKEQVLEFVDAANMTNVALGEDLGEDAVKNIGKLAQMFGDGSHTLKEDMLAIGSAVNQVAQSSSAAEPYLVEFTARMGGVGKQANMAVTDIMGFASALDQNMLRSEMASTALQSLILKIYQEPAKYAQLAGMDVKEFVNLVNTDVNEALLKFLGTLGKMGGMAEMSPILKEMKLSGAEAAGVISALAGNIDQVRREQENANKAFQDGTSIGNEYAVQNNTVQAGLEKAKNQFRDVRVELGQQLLPVMRYMVSTGSMTVKSLSAMVKWFIEYKGVILSTMTAIAAYTLVVKGVTIATKAYELVTKAAAAATTLFSTAIKSSPWGLVISGVTAVVSYFAFFRDETDKTTESVSAMNDELDRTKETMDLISKVKLSADNLQFLTEKQKQQMKLDAQRGIEELDELITQGMIANKKWYEAEKKSLLKLAGDNKILQQSYMRGLEHDLKERAAVIAGYIDQKKELQRIIELVPDEEGKTPAIPVDKSEAENALKQHYQNELNLLKEKYLNEQLTEEQYQNSLYKAEISYFTARKALLQKYGEDTSEIQGQIYDKMISEANRLQQAAKNATDNVSNDLLATLEDEYNQQVSDTRQAYIDGDIQRESDYQERLKEIEEDYLQQRLDMLIAFGMDTSDVYRKMQENELKKKSGNKAEKDKQLETQLTSTTDYDSQLNILQQMYDADIINYEEYQQRKDELAEEHEAKRRELVLQALDMISQGASTASQLVQTLQDREISKIENRYDRQIEAAEKAGKDTTQLEEEKEETVSAVKKKYADKQFTANVLQIISDTAVAVMRSWAELGPILGPIYAALAAAQGAAQVAVAKQQRDEAKGLKSGGYSREYIEGYTSKGNPDDVAGVIPVHKNEFVANHLAVANPSVRQFLDVFDTAQKNGTIRMLNTTQILEQVRSRSGLFTGGYAQNTARTGQAEQTGDWSSLSPDQRLQVVTLLAENNRLLRIICDKELVVDARKVRDGIRKVENMEKNVYR